MVLHRFSRELQAWCPDFAEEIDWDCRWKEPWLPLAPTNQCWDSGKVEDGHVEDFFEEHRGRLKTYIVRIKEASIVSEEKHV